MIAILAPLVPLLVSLANPAHPGRTPARSRAEDIIAKSKAAYAALKTYADTGMVESEYGNSSIARHQFRTFFRSPRTFWFEFLKEGDADRLVVWSDDQAFHAWWRTTGVQTDYPKGRGGAVFIGSGYPTRGSINMVTPFLFPGAGLTGTLIELEDPSETGMEAVDGHQCHKVVGIAKTTYRSGNQVNIRRTTVWIDAQSFLVRKVVEEVPRGSPGGSWGRTYTTIKPYPNPKLEDKRFQFTPPSTQN